MATKTAIVTGGSSGIGLATARGLLTAGYRVLICARGRKRLRESAERLGDTPRLDHRVLDVSDAAAVSAAVDHLVEQWGRLDVVVNSHGISAVAVKPIEHLSQGDWAGVLQVNLMGVVNMISAAIPHLRATRGSIVNISSISAMQGVAGRAPYGVAKAGVTALTTHAAAELAEMGIRVNAVAPGWVMTPMVESAFRQAGVLESPIDSNMLRRPADPKEIANAVVFLAGDRASFITAQTLIVDGGDLTLASPLREAEASSPRP